MLVKHNNNSISNLTSVNLPQGKMTLISEQTASGSASISFTSGIDSTYPIYKFEFFGIHPSIDNAFFGFNMSTDSGSSYAVTKTTTAVGAYLSEANQDAEVIYQATQDLAQSTSYQKLLGSLGNDNDENGVGFLLLFNPSSTTFVKHFIATTNGVHQQPANSNRYIAGYGNTTDAVDAIDFKMESGNIDSGTIKLYGIKGD